MPDYGDGSIFQRNDDYWVAKYKNPLTGKIKYFYSKKKSVVKNKLKEYKESIGFSDEKTDSISMDAFLNDWLKNELSLSLKPKSYDIKEYIINKLVVPYFEGIQVGQVTPEDIQGFIKHLADKGYSYSTIKKSYDVLNQRYRLAVERRQLQFSPVVGIILPKKNERTKGDIRFFSEDELSRIIESAYATYPNGTPIYRCGCIIDFLAHTGLRIGEALALTWGDIDMDNNKIYVNKNIVFVSDRKTGKSRVALKQDSPKTEAGNRVVPLSQSAKNALFVAGNVQNLHFSTPRNTQLVFCARSGLPLSNKNVARMFEQIQKRAGVEPKGTLHSLRHTFASRLIQLGVDVKVVSKLLGHSDISVTYNTYVHIIEEQQVKAVEKLDSI